LCYLRVGRLGRIVGGFKKKRGWGHLKFGCVSGVLSTTPCPYCTNPRGGDETPCGIITRKGRFGTWATFHFQQYQSRDNCLVGVVNSVSYNRRVLNIHIVDYTRRNHGLHPPSIPQHINRETLKFEIRSEERLLFRPVLYKTVIDAVVTSDTKDYLNQQAVSHRSFHPSPTINHPAVRIWG
jgi:hypothetical protein